LRVGNRDLGVSNVVDPYRDLTARSDVPIGGGQRDHEAIARGIGRDVDRAGGNAPVSVGRGDTDLDVAGGDAGDAPRKVRIGVVIERYSLEPVSSDGVVLSGDYRDPVLGSGTRGGRIRVGRTAIGFERDRREGTDSTENGQQDQRNGDDPAV
jgi:hypothetical protein